MSDIVERLRSANTWLNEGDCCGQIDASGTCMAPACIFGEALKLSAEAAAEIERLRAALELYRDAVRIDATMEGPKFMGANTSALKRAWDADRAALEGK